MSWRTVASWLRLRLPESKWKNRISRILDRWVFTSCVLSCWIFNNTDTIATAACMETTKNTTDEDKKLQWWNSCGVITGTHDWTNWALLPSTWSTSRTCCK